MSTKARPKVEWKPYRCTRCGCVRDASTNHYGEFYDRCPGCSWSHPMDPIAVWECMAPVASRPADAWVPEPWKKVRLGDVCDIVIGGKAGKP